MRRTLLTLLAGWAALASLMFAQDPDPNDQQQEPDGQYEQGRGVARVSVLNGDVSVRRGDSGDVIAAALNAPLMANDAVLTGSASRAEVQLDWGNLVRIAPNSEVRFTGLDVKSFQIQVAAGTVTFRVLRQSQAEAEVDTPSVAVRPLGQGTYRISVRDDGTSEITIRSGEADILSPHGSERLTPGRTMYARGDASDPEFQVIGAIAPDTWDRWNEDRDQYLLRSRSYEHVSPDVNGAEDLDQYGTWTNDPNYGYVWQPNVAPGWAPYQSGRWVWEDYYGWTWVSYDPWGWAPYHYGRWFWGAGGWCWYPGPVFGHYFWSPAYVGFFGWGGHVGFGFGFGGLGWVALAPFEHYHPWWGRGYYGGFRGGFARNTTIVNNANITNVYRNSRVSGAAMGVNANQFGRGAQFQTLNHAQIQQAGLVHGAVPVSPTRASLQVSNRAASGNFPQTRAVNFASHMPATQVNRVPFEQQQRAIQQIRPNVTDASRVGAGNLNTGTSGGAGSWRRATPGSSPVAGPASRGTSTGSGSGNTGHGWSRFGEPIHGGSTQAYNGGASRSSTTNGGNGWQRFENTRPGGSGSGYGNSGGSGQAIHISPPMVQRTPNYSPSYQAPRSYSPSYPAPRSYSPSYQAPRGSSSGTSSKGYSGGGGGGSKSSGGGGGSHGGGGGGGHSGGGGGHGGGGHR